MKLTKKILSPAKFKVGNLFHTNLQNIAVYGAPAQVYRCTDLKEEYVEGGEEFGEEWYKREATLVNVQDSTDVVVMSDDTYGEYPLLDQKKIDKINDKVEEAKALIAQYANIVSLSV